MNECPLPPGSRVWCYSRDSGGDDQTVDDQNRAIDAYCKDNSLVVERLFCDRASPGSSTAGREQFQAMIHLARNAPTDVFPAGIVFWSLSRFARDYDDAQFYKADLRRRGLVLVSIADDLPADGPHARLIEAVVDWKNEQFLEDLRRDVKRGLHDLARQGYAPGGFPPRGYVARKVQLGVKNSGEPRMVSEWTPDPELAPRVKRAWEMRAHGASYKTIHDETRVFGSTNSYACMFRNKTYLGIRKCGELEIPDAHEPLITHEIWTAVQATLRTRPSRGESWPEGKQHPRQVRSPFLLSGLARCAYCGSAVCGSHTNLKNRPNPWAFYLCGRRKRQGYSACQGRNLNARVVEEAVLDAVLTRILTPAFVEELVTAVNVYLSQDTVGLDQSIDEMRHKITEVNRAIAGLLDLAERYGADSAGPRILEREAERRQLEQELRALEIRRDQSHVEISPEVVLHVLAGAREQLIGEDVHARRTTLRQFVTKVEVGNEGGRLWYTFPLDKLASTATSLYLVPPQELDIKTSLELVWDLP